MIVIEVAPQIPAEPPGIHPRPSHAGVDEAVGDRIGAQQLLGCAEVGRRQLPDVSDEGFAFTCEGGHGWKSRRFRRSAGPIRLPSARPTAWPLRSASPRSGTQGRS